MKIVRKLFESFLVIGSGGISHLVIPHLSKEGSTTFIHLVKHNHDLVVVRGIEHAVESKVGLHGLDPSGGIKGFS